MDDDELFVNPQGVGAQRQQQLRSDFNLGGKYAISRSSLQYLTTLFEAVADFRRDHVQYVLILEQQYFNALSILRRVQCLQPFIGSFGALLSLEVLFRRSLSDGPDRFVFLDRLFPMSVAHCVAVKHCSLSRPPPPWFRNPSFVNCVVVILEHLVHPICFDFGLPVSLEPQKKSRNGSLFPRNNKQLSESATRIYLCDGYPPAEDSNS